MRVSKVAVAAIFGLHLLAAAAFAADGRGSGGSGGQTQAASGHHSGGSRHGGSWHGGHAGWGGSRYVGWGGYGGWGGYYGWGGWGPGWGWGPYWYGPGWGYSAVYPRVAMRHGALDLDVSPERAEIWLDGNLLGVADDFDGFPDLLWLEEGTYDVAIYLPGYRTIARQYTVRAGLVIDVEDHLQQGESIHPGDLVSKSHVNRDERLRRDRQAQEEAREQAWRASGDDEEWSGGSVPEESLDARNEPARIRLEVIPEDASVYLDGRFLGTGRDLARLRAGLLVDPGLHTLEVVRPGYASTQRSIEVGAGAEQEVEIELEEGG